MLGSLVEVYVEQMKTSMPQVENAFDTMARRENRKAEKEAVALYHSSMIESIQMPALDDDEFSSCHEDCSQRAIDAYLQRWGLESLDSDSSPDLAGLGLESFTSGLGLETCGLGLDSDSDRRDSTGLGKLHR